jgi:hypothetical protein
MDVTITLKDAGLILIGVGLVILIAYCIAFMKNLVITVKHANKILEDTQVISKIAADKSKEVDKVINDVAYSVGSVSDIIKGNQSIIAALTSIINALGSVKNIIKGSKKG